jgi:hypothetical protein
MKCSGISRESNLCLKCKDTVMNLWDNACQPREKIALDQSPKGSETTRFTLLALTWIFVYLL